MRILWETCYRAHIALPSSVRPAVTRLQRATAEAQQAVQDRAQASVEEEKANKYARFFMR